MFNATKISQGIKQCLSMEMVYEKKQELTSSATLGCNPSAKSRNFNLGLNIAYGKQSKIEN